MNFDALLALLITVTICALIAFLAALLLRTRQSILGYIGAGLFGQALGGWIAGAINGTSWPGSVTLGSASIHLLWTFIGALILLAIFGYAPRLRRGRFARRG